jgi:hypothetical protein
MELEDRLRICLLALESRYPEHVVSINTAMLGIQHKGAECWSAGDMLEYLELAAPDLLDEMACLIIDIQQSNIYIVNRSSQVPALTINCQGRVPERRTSRPLIDQFITEPLIIPPSSSAPGASA